MAVPLTLSSVPAQTPYVQYIATAGQTVFPYPFEITQDSDLVCLINGVQQPTDGGYTLTGQGATGGGNLTFTLGQTAGAIITLFRNIPISRVTQLSQNGTFFSANFNNEYNRLYLIAQQLQQSIGQCLQVPISNSPAPITTLSPSPYAGCLLGFDAFGNPQAVGYSVPGNNSNTSFTGVANSAPNVLYTRNSGFTGGTEGFTTPCVEIVTNVTAGGDTNNEWPLVVILNNSAAYPAENVAGYFQANKTGNVGPTWGAVIQVQEQTAINNPSNGTVALEIDINCNGTDGGIGNRVGIDLVIAPYTAYPAGADAFANWGFRVSNGNDGTSAFGFGFALDVGCIADVGFDTSHGTMQEAAFQLAENQTIVFDGPTTQANAVGYDGTGLFYKSSGTKGVRFTQTGLQIYTGGGLVQVVGPRIGGYGTPTGGSHQLSFAAGSITLGDLAAAVAQLIIDLKTHGLLGA